MPKRRTKVYSSRRAVTAVLRRLKIPVDKHDNFIKKMGSKQFVCYIVDAEEYSANLKSELDEQKAAKKNLKRQCKATGRETISGLCRRMIIAGDSDEVILQSLKDTFGESRITPSKYQYPVWYRCELRRAGKLPPAFDYEQRDKTALHRLED